MRAPAHAKALSVIRVEHSDGRTGAEYEITRLRSLEYTQFTTVVHTNEWGTERYLVGITKPVTITHQNEIRHRRKWVATGDPKKFFLGPYAIYIPFSGFENNQTNGIHFIPTKAPNSLSRHMHHVANRGGNEGKHPLDMRTSTCWGGFGSSVSSLVDICDIPELYRYLYLYVSRYDMHSPMNRIEELDFDTTTETS